MTGISELRRMCTADHAAAWEALAVAVRTKSAFRFSMTEDRVRRSDVAK